MCPETRTSPPTPGDAHRSALSPRPLLLSVLLGYVLLPPTSFLFISRALPPCFRLICRGFSSAPTGLDPASQPQPG